jgi:EPS-associated MarR family transcriptional regulator
VQLTRAAHAQLTVADLTGYVHTLNSPFSIQADSLVSDQTSFSVMRLLAANPSRSQREIASSVGVSLGTVNYCLRALMVKGFVKAENYRKSRNKLAYLYLLSPAGVAAKAELTRRFLEHKVREYEALRLEIERLEGESRAAGVE